MRITDLHVDGFGVWNDLRLKKLSPEITVFYGDNEAGKTTLLEFLRSMMYGVSGARREKYLPPMDGGKPGGRMGLLSEAGPFEVQRYVERGEDDRGRVSIHLPSGDKQGDRLLRDALEGVDEVTFNNVFAVGLDEIQELGTQAGAEAAKSIYRLTSGLDRVSLYDLIVGLRESRTQLLDKAGLPSVLGDLVAKRDAVKTEISDLTAQNRRWSKIAVELDELNKRIETTRAELKSAEKAARRVEVGIGLKPHWQERLKIDDQLAQYTGLYQLPPTAIEDLDELNGKIEEHRRQRDILRGQRKQLREEADELGVNDVLVRNCCRLDALTEQQDWIVALNRDTERLEEEADGLQSKLDSEQRRLGKVWEHDPQHTPELTEEMVDQLETVAEGMHAAEKELKRAQSELEAKRGSELKYRTKIESAMTVGDKMGLPTDINEAGDLVAQLRRRLQVEQRVEQSRRHALELEQQSHELLDRQVMPLDLFWLLGAMFILGGLMIGWWWWHPNSALGTLGGWTAVIGIAGSIFAWFFKYFVEESAADQLDATQRQMELIDKQIHDAKREQDKLNLELPLTEGSAVLQLQKAERHLNDLEKVLPVESQRRQADGEAAAADAAYKSAQQRFNKASEEWKAGLRALGLPDRITPGDLTTMAVQYEKLAELRVKLENRQDDVQRRRREFASVTERITALAEEADLVLEDEDATPIEQLDVLLSERRLQQSRIDHRQKLLDRAKELKDKEIKHHKSAEAIDERRQSLFRTSGVADEAEYRRLASDLTEAAKLREKRERVTGEIAAAIGRLGTEEDFAQMMAVDRVDRLDAKWDKLSAKQEEIDNQLRELLSKRGALEEQRKTLGEDTVLADKRMQLDAIEVQIADAKDRWRERAAVGQLLELIRSDYEANRQPETLLEATRYMERLTGGRYNRVWTPLANDILLVDNQDGQSMPVESLSRGTREQLFLSVRLAIVAMFARRGIGLPMILDDVLVNFDVGRARTAAEVLCEFAKEGHQLLVFTCHEHVWDMFKSLNADVRRLPNRFGETLPELPVIESVAEEVIEEVVEEPVVEEPVVEEIVVEEVVIEPEPLVAEYGAVETPEPIAKAYLEAAYEELQPVAETVEVEIPEPVGEEVVFERQLVEVDYSPRSTLMRAGDAPVEIEYGWANRGLDYSSPMHGEPEFIAPPVVTATRSIPSAEQVEIYPEEDREVVYTPR